MNEDLLNIQSQLQGMLRAHIPLLQIRKDNDTVFEVAGTIETMQGKQKVDGFYFASVVPKPKDIRLYYFPIYTHPDAFEKISYDLRKCLKGKSCFHIKSLSDSLADEINQMIKIGIDLYRQAGLI